MTLPGIRTITYFESNKGKFVEWSEVQKLLDEIAKLQRHIDQMSCCCSGCMKHNANIGKTIEKQNEKE